MYGGKDQCPRRYGCRLKAALLLSLADSGISWSYILASWPPCVACTITTPAAQNRRPIIGASMRLRFYPSLTVPPPAAAYRERGTAEARRPCPAGKRVFTDMVDKVFTSLAPTVARPGL